MIWETVVINPDEGGATSYVISFRKYTLTKDGKIIAEWLRYDKLGINEIVYI